MKRSKRPRSKVGLGPAGPVEDTWPSVQTALRLPHDLYARLKLAGGDRGLAEEIRRRLEVSFDAERGSKTTRELTTAIAQLADTMTLDGEWHDSAFAFEVFQVAMNTLLKHWQPKGDPTVRPKTARIFFAPGVPAETVGRMLAGIVLRDLAQARDE